jgi:hypothetical protein
VTLPRAAVIKEPADIVDMIERVEVQSRAQAKLHRDAEYLKKTGRHRPAATSLPGPAERRQG